MKIYEIINPNGHHTYEYKEEQKGDIIEVTLKIKIDTKWKSEINYIEKCKGKKCLATKTIKSINDQIKSENERDL